MLERALEASTRPQDNEDVQLAAAIEASTRTEKLQKQRALLDRVEAAIVETPEAVARLFGGGVGDDGGGAAATADDGPSAGSEAGHVGWAWRQDRSHMVHVPVHSMHILRMRRSGGDERRG